LNKKYYEERSSSITSQENKLSVTSETLPLKEIHQKKGQSVGNRTSKVRQKNLEKSIPDVQIKIGVQNNHYNFFNTINESDEDDDKLVRVMGLKNKKFKVRKSFYFSR